MLRREHFPGAVLGEPDDPDSIRAAVGVDPGGADRHPDGGAGDVLAVIEVRLHDVHRVGDVAEGQPVGRCGGWKAFCASEETFCEMVVEAPADAGQFSETEC